MPRTLPANAIAEIAKPLGVEPINIVGVDWTGSGTEILYADRDLAGVLGRIIELSEFDEVVKATGNSTVTVRVSLDDTDGELKTIYNTTDIHKKRCSVYQYFGNLSLDDKFLLFRGEISTPVVWDEGKRILSFDILSQIESEEVGFSPEEGQFTDVSPAAVGKVWPLCFGSVAHVPVVKTSDVIRGNLVTTIGIPDATLPLKRKQLVFNLNYYIQALAYYSKVMEVAYTIARPPIDIASDYLLTIKTEDELKQVVEDYSAVYEENKEELDKLIQLLDEAPTAQDAADVQAAIDALTPIVSALQYELSLYKPQLDYAEAYKEYVEIEVDNAQYEFETIGKLRETIVKILEYISETAFELNRIDAVTVQQQHLSQTVFTVVNGHKFPQSTQVRLICKGMILIGSFTGDVFTLTQIEPRYRNVAIAPRQSTGQSIVAQSSINAYGVAVQIRSMDLTDLNAFWISDATVELAGNYCLLSTGKIIKVSDQIGTKCFFDLEEIRVDREKQKPYEPAEEKDLTSWLWGQIVASGAQEYTTKERERKLREALSQDAKDSLKSVEDRLEKLIELIDQAPTQEDRRAVQQAIYRDMGAYESIVASLRLPRKDKLEAYRYISQQEFNNFLKLENLHRKEYWRAVQPPIVDVAGDFAVTGPDVVGSISEVAPVILPSWLPFLSGQLLSDLEEITTKLPNGQTILVDKIPRTTLWVAEAGTDVTLDASYQEKYVCNILPSTIQAVYANRAVNGFKRLVPVPSSYYVKNEADNYGPYTCTTITLRKPLSEYDDEGWEGDLYVSLISSVGPNTALIIKWILQQYTNTIIDSTSFDYVENRLTNYPSHFALFDKQDALALIEKIAWQARCNVILKHGTAYLQYLSEIPDSIATIEQSDIEHESLEISYTNTEELVTKFVGKWKTHYQQDDTNKTILRHNIIKYGNIEKEFDFFIYNIESLVIKSATFWMIRYANTWKKIKFKTFLTNLKVESFDAITIDLGDSLVASSSVLGLVEKASYDSNDYSITIECWLPVRAGEMVAYDYAFPADLAAETVFPTVEDVAAGIAGGDSRIPTGTSFALRQPNEIEYIELRPKDYGSRFPSDAADTVPLNPLAGYYEVDFKIQKINEYLMRTMPGVTSVATDRSAGQRPEQPQPEDNNWIGRVDSYVGGRIYKVSRSDGQVYNVHELGFNQTAITLPGTRRNVSWNRHVRRYEMVRTVVQSGTMKEVRVDTHIDDLIICIDANEDYLWVAKPYSLQKTAWDGSQITLNGTSVALSYDADGSGGRTVINLDNTDETEYQVVVPDYVTGEWITIWRTETGLVDDQDEPVLWQDLNTAARAWAYDPESEE